MMIESQSENIQNPEEILDNKPQQETSNSIDKDNMKTDENPDNSEETSKEVKKDSNNIEDALNTVARLEQLEKEHQTLKNQYVRIAADFDNFRKRQSRDQDDLKVQLICKSLSAILPIVDLSLIHI